MNKKIRTATVVLLTAFLSFSFLSCSADNKAEALTFEKSLTPVKYSDVNPEKPFETINWGLFDYQNTTSASTPRGGQEKDTLTVNTTGRYSVYIPRELDIRSRVIVILTPADTTAFDFARSEIGMDWMRLSYETNEFAVAFAEPLGGKTWNTTLAPVDNAKAGTPRDERAFIYDVYKSLSAGTPKEKPYISVDKSGLSIIGYSEGADMAAVLAAGYPALFPNTILVDPVKYEGDTIDALLAEGAFPHIIGTTSGFDRCKNGDIGMPLYICSENAEVKKAYTDKWTAINDEAKIKINDTQAEPELLQVTELTAKDAATLFAAANANNRYMGYSGGTVRARFDFDAPNWEKHEERIAGDSLDLVRRWYVYTPDNLPKGEKVPLVTVLHGSSASIRDVAEESRWTKIADENGFIVLFCQGNVSTNNPGTSAPISGWKAMNYSETNPDTVYINKVIDKVVAKGNIDESRLYLTGHSLGGMMTSTIMGTDAFAKRFAAYAPVGAFLPSNQNCKFRDTPLYALTGEWESSGAFPGTGRDGKPSDGSILSFLKYFGMVEESVSELPSDVQVTHKGEPYSEDKFDTLTYVNDEGAPFLMHTVVNDSPHTYMADRARLIWEDFFSHYHRDENGKAVYTK
jgi:Poly(3-hydroxybutyrate) depolymerase